jgi:hypothetical protein
MKILLELSLGGLECQDKSRLRSRLLDLWKQVFWSWLTILKLRLLNLDCRDSQNKSICLRFVEIKSLDRDKSRPQSLIGTFENSENENNSHSPTQIFIQTIQLQFQNVTKYLNIHWAIYVLKLPLNICFGMSLVTFLKMVFKKFITYLLIFALIMSYINNINKKYILIKGKAKFIPELS